MKLDVSKKQEDFGIVLEKTKRYIEVVKPASIFITRAEYSNPVDAAIKAMGRANLPVYVIAITTDESTDAMLASIMVQVMRRNVLRKLRGTGVNVIEVEAGKMEKVMVGLAR